MLRIPLPRRFIATPLIPLIAFALILSVPAFGRVVEEKEDPDATFPSCNNVKKPLKTLSRQGVDKTANAFRLKKEIEKEFEWDMHEPTLKNKLDNYLAQCRKLKDSMHDQDLKSFNQAKLEYNTHKTAVSEKVQRALSDKKYGKGGTKYSSFNEAKQQVTGTAEYLNGELVKGNVNPKYKAETQKTVRDLRTCHNEGLNRAEAELKKSWAKINDDEKRGLTACANVVTGKDSSGANKAPKLHRNATAAEMDAVNNIGGDNPDGSEDRAVDLF